MLRKSTKENGAAQQGAGAARGEGEGWEGGRQNEFRTFSHNKFKTWPKPKKDAKE